jgi:hypothetical protein
MDEVACRYTNRRTSLVCPTSRTHVPILGVASLSRVMFSTASGGVTECPVALLPQLGVEQQVNGTRLSTRARARGGPAAPCIRMPHTAFFMRRC